MVVEASNSTGHRGCMYRYEGVNGTEGERREYEQRDMYRERLRQKKVMEDEGGRRCGWWSI